MIQEVKMYTVICDNCGKDADIAVREHSFDLTQWRQVDGKDICPDCWEWNDKDELVIKKNINER